MSRHDSEQTGYRIKLVYSEPVFNLWNPGTPKEYSSEYVYRDARSPEEAYKMAIAHWEFCKKNSSVGWRRELKSISVEH